MEKSAPNHPGKPYTPPLSGNAQWKQHISKVASLNPDVSKDKVLLSVHLGVGMEKVYICVKLANKLIKSASLRIL